MTDQAVEVAVTFDKAYTIKEIAELVPDNLMINWYWIGSSSNYDTAELTADAQLGLTAYDGTEPSQSDLETFKENLNSALSKGYLDRTYDRDSDISLNLVDDARTYLETSDSQEKMTFSGLILTGRAENFKSLQNASWIFGSNLGQSVIIQPYHTLSK
ncbi:anti sigma factor C-terminal domain-containing protein [Streptococcus loxodontisalivarius]|uniref:Sigma factor regulator C-terminal domain-containing protein n=1 Tax=Streptococcus loxodontisalivarius TaxID=1349415 RepID=A0ABS2PR89_9STRE|nr:anti sigma factor C-terminal domain-containing protein [Streptococcus loxodontisalivarius]MBM7642554.1 hypothetical protein [Streptococcus loxodontisalivarius]